MSASRRALLLSGTVCLLIFGHTGLACAADATPAQAAAMETQVREAITGLLGPAVKLANSPIKITAAGDHYDILVPYTLPKHSATGTPTLIQLTGTAKPGDNGTWIVENLKTTNPLTFSNDVPVPSSTPGAPATTATETYTINQVGQSGRILWDPSFKTPSTWTTSNQSMTMKIDRGPVEHGMSFGPASSVTTLRPAGADRIDVLLDGSIQDYRVNSAPEANAGAPGPMDAAIKTLRFSAAMDGVSREHATSLLQSLVSVLVTLVNAPPTLGQPPKIAPETMKALLASLQDFASDFKLDETMEGFIVKTQGQTAALDRIRLGFDARSDTGLLKAGMTLGVEGLTLPDMPLGDMAALIPTRVSIRPVVGGLAVADLMHLANLASENKNPAPADITALFSHGGITGGIESMGIDVAGAKFTGEGKVVATGPSPDAMTGTATITAENFDTLMQKVTTMPALAQQAVPVMVFIKGVGRAVDNKLVWDISYKGNKLLVNNVDLTAMAGGPPAGAAAPPAAAPMAPPPAPAPVVPPAMGGKGPSGTVRPLPSWAK